MHHGRRKHLQIDKVLENFDEQLSVEFRSFVLEARLFLHRRPVQPKRVIIQQLFVKVRVQRSVRNPVVTTHLEREALDQSCTTRIRRGCKLWSATESGGLLDVGYQYWMKNTKLKIFAIGRFKLVGLDGPVI